MTRIATIILLLALCFSCKNEKKEEKKEFDKESKEEVFRKIKNKEDRTDHFQVILNFMATKDDSFQLFYSQDYVIDYLEEESITRGFVGQEQYQSIIFDLPKGIFPGRYRLDTGSNINQNMIKIESLTIRYSEKEIFIPQNLIPQYLVPNDFINYNEVENKYYLKTLEVDGNMVYDPYFTCSPELVRLLIDL